MEFVKLAALVMAIIGHAVATGKGSGTGTSNYRSSSPNYGTVGTSSVSIGGGSSDYYGGRNSYTSTGYRESTSSRSFVDGSFGRYGQNEAPQPHNFDYKSDDEQGNSHYHREEADASGTVRGSYGYTDIQGLYRIVDYIADANGFRASIRTNEPGTDGKENPADVQMTVDQPPAGIQDRYTTFSGTGGFRGTGGATRSGGSYGGGGVVDPIYGVIGRLYTSGDGSSENFVSGGGATNTGPGGGARSGKSGY